MSANTCEHPDCSPNGWHVPTTPDEPPSPCPNNPDLLDWADQPDEA